MHLFNVNDAEFARYGRVLELDTREIEAAALTLEMPEKGSVYEASVEVLEKTALYDTLQNEVFGEMKIQIGCCWGHSDSLNALEWHKSSEVNIAAEEMILFLGNVSELEGEKYNSENVRAFLVPKGTAIEVFATTMHFCPCETSGRGFCCIVVLPEGTNLPLDGKPADKFLFRKNKWLMSHNDNTGLIERGAAPGLYGKNFRVGEDV